MGIAHRWNKNRDQDGEGGRLLSSVAQLQDVRVLRWRAYKLLVFRWIVLKATRWYQDGCVRRRRLKGELMIESSLSGLPPAAPAGNVLPRKLIFHHPIVSVSFKSGQVACPFKLFFLSPLSGMQSAFRLINTFFSPFGERGEIFVSKIKKSRDAGDLCPVLFSSVVIY